MRRRWWRKRRTFRNALQDQTREDEKTMNNDALQEASSAMLGEIA